MIVRVLPGPLFTELPRRRVFSETQTLLGPTKKRAGSITPWRSFLSHYWEAARVHPISTTSVILPALFLSLRCFVASRRLFYLHMPIPRVVMHRPVPPGAKEENRRRDVEVQQQRESGAEA